MTIADQEGTPENGCLGCRAVAFFTPLGVSSLAGHYLSTSEWVLNHPTLNQSKFRMSTFKLSSRFYLPFCMCYMAYSGMYKFGAYRPLPEEMQNKSTLEIMQKKLENSSYLESLVDDIKFDSRTFSREVKSLFGDLYHHGKQSASDLVHNVQDCRTRTLKMFRAPDTKQASPPSPPPPVDGEYSKKTS